MDRKNMPSTDTSKFSDTTISLKSFCEDYVNKEQPLNVSEKNSILKKINENDKLLEKIQKEQLELGRILDYDKLNKKGFTFSEIADFIKKDDLAIEKAKDFMHTNLSMKDYMFGYPLNIPKESAMTKFFKYLETQLTLINNCGDSKQLGNLRLNCKAEYEQPILEIFFKHFKIDEESTGKTPWGYITGGGTESNYWGIINGLRRLPNARVYYSEGAHYSVAKAVAISPDINGNSIDIIKHTEIPTEKTSEKIDVEKLTTEIEKNWKEKDEPAVILLTWGTTKYGAFDNVSEISNILKEKQIPHYIHVDAALSGGIAKNQTDAPILHDINMLGIDSISISFHKYFGSPEVKSIVITKEEPYSKHIDYIGVKDSTTAGSRCFCPFSTMQRIVETFERSTPEEYSSNINLFEKKLKEKQIFYTKEPLSNTFVIDKPSDEICQKYQLSTFSDNDGNIKAHIIIFPYHPENMIENLINDIINDRKK